ncbi:MAG: hypothetical protein WC022_01495 [Parcubacteria group bacterium]
MNIKQTYERYKRKKILNLLLNTEPAKIIAMGEKMAIPAFRRAATRMPAYKKILNDHKVDIAKIRSVADFAKLPILSKKTLFPLFDIEELCMDGDLSVIQGAMTSSGFSGIYSFGINTPQNYKTIAMSIDMGLQANFDIDHKKTFFINALPMGVKVRTSLPLAETSVRDDMVLALLKKISPKFTQTIILSDPHFIKKIVDTGNAQKIDWEKLGVSFVLGEDWFSESFRTYLAEETGLDLDKPNGRLIGTTMGVAELDLNIFHEGFETIQIRRAAVTDKKLREALFGQDAELVPIIFHYYPHRTYMEAVPEKSDDQELVFSMLSQEMAIPLIRYNSGDKGKLMTHTELAKILTECGYERFIPKLKLPIVCVWGRKDRCLIANGVKIYPEIIKQGLYENTTVARTITGHFFLSNETDPQMEIQLRKDIALKNITDLDERIKKALSQYKLPDMKIIIYPYADYPHAMELDYEKKFNNL